MILYAEVEGPVKGGGTGSKRSGDRLRFILSPVQPFSLAQYPLWSAECSSLLYSSFSGISCQSAALPL